MRSLFRLFPLLLLGLYACTGSQEPLLPALVAAGGEGQVRFFRAQDLQRGAGSPVGTWNTPGLQDLAYSNASGRLYLLFPDRVEAYATQGFTENAAPQAPPLSAPLPADCTGGYLRLGQNRLLVHCPGAGRAFLLNLADLGNQEEADLTGLPPGSRLALYPQNTLELLAYLTDTVLGYRPPSNPTGSPKGEAALGLAFTPSDLRLDPIRGRLLGAGRGATETYLVRWEGTSPSTPPLGLQGAVRLALDPVQGLVAYGGGFRALEPRDSGPRQGFSTYGAGLVGQDAYLYLVRGGLLEVYDLQANPFPASPQATALLGFSPSALAFIPVE
ncbi:MAG: hypothetical protein RMI36_08805 [Thermus sp.]|uniref:hypothetical protein n=1 Tax=Thermus sp. TaxID=275 RepID=UPI00298EFE4D|nr:hypothetical protein [Thermus sp.]MDW8017906.1 hypothetical protein [Thermus sp.]